VRHLAHELRPSVLDDLGLIPACEFLADGVSRRFGVTVNVYGSTGGRLPPALETALYRISQEALTNGVKHGRANRMVLEFHRRRATLAGKIWDDGTGFDVKAALGGGDVKEKGLGLVGMRQRLVELGGSLSITSRIGHGTTIEFEAPVGALDVSISAARG
jgi:signal transduction histidine kinase